MDARAYLTNQGWKGKGHALRAGGISAPILTSKKTDLKGLGSKSGYKESDQWWDNIFSKQLQSIGVTKSTSESSGGSVIGLCSTNLQQYHPVQARFHAKQVAGEGRLSKHFVKGEGLQGSIEFATLDKPVVNEMKLKDVSKSREKSKAKVKSSLKRSKDEPAIAAETKELKKARKMERAVRKEERRVKKAKKALKSRGEVSLATKVELKRIETPL